MAYDPEDFEHDHSKHPERLSNSDRSYYNNNFNQQKRKNTMSYNQGGAQQQQSRNNRFGEAQVLKTAYEIVNKKSGEVISGSFKCYFETGGNLFKIEVSPRLKETKTGANAMWVKITKKKKQSPQTQQRF